MDKLGRIVLPVELRKSLKIDLNTYESTVIPSYDFLHGPLTK